MFGKRLKRQLKKFLATENLSESLKSVLSNKNAESFDTLSHLSENIDRFLNDIDQTYIQMDERLERSKTNLEISSRELVVANQNISSMMDSLGQGFMTFNKAGMCSSTYSKACEEIFGLRPAGKYIWDVLPLDEENIEQLKSWSQLVFQDRIEFKEIENLAPCAVETEDGKLIDLTYRVSRNHPGEIESIVVVATDKTNEQAAIIAASQQTRHAERVVTILANKVHFVKFLRYFESFVSENTINCDLSNKEYFEDLQRGLHTIKGSAGTFLLDDLQNEVHEMESQLRLNNHSISDEHFSETLKLWKTELDIIVNDLENFFGEALDVNTQSVQIEKSSAEAFHKKLTSSGLGELAEDFFHSFLQEPVGSSVGHLPWLAKDLAKRMGKELDTLEISGGSIKINPTRYQSLFSTFVHVIRNSIDHGIESSEDRALTNKPLAAKIKLSFRAENGIFHIIFEDDGRGINSEDIVNKCLKMGIAVDSKQPYEALIQNILLPKFSTASVVSTISGRGIGLDSVAEEVKKLNGKIYVQSEPGEYFKIVIKIPFLENENYTEKKDVLSRMAS